MPKGKEDLVFSFIPKYNKFQEYYDVLGPKRLKALYYAKGSMEKELERALLDKSKINREILSKFNVGDKITSVETKSIITEIFKNHGYTKAPKGSVLSDYFIVKEAMVYEKVGSKFKSHRGYRIVSVKPEWKELYDDCRKLKAV